MMISRPERGRTAVVIQRVLRSGPGPLPRASHGPAVTVLCVTGVVVGGGHRMQTLAHVLSVPPQDFLCSSPACGWAASWPLKMLREFGLSLRHTCTGSRWGVDWMLGRWGCPPSWDEKEGGPGPNFRNSQGWVGGGEGWETQSMDNTEEA